MCLLIRALSWTSLSLARRTRGHHRPEAAKTASASAVTHGLAFRVLVPPQMARSGRVLQGGAGDQPEPTVSMPRQFSTHPAELTRVGGPAGTLFDLRSLSP